MNDKERVAMQQAFETWWEREGQEFLFALNTTTDDDIKLVAEVAWKNGAYCAEQADGEQWSPDDMAYRPSGLSMEQAEQEPVAWGRVFDGDIIDCICPEEHALNEGVYTTPLYAAPVRTKDLTDDELEELCRKYARFELIREAIAADREKNK